MTGQYHAVIPRVGYRETFTILHRKILSRPAFFQALISAPLASAPFVYDLLFTKF